MNGGHSVTNGGIEHIDSAGQNTVLVKNFTTDNLFIAKITIDDLNRTESDNLVLVSVFLYILLVVGIVGNSFVIYIYACRIPLSAHKCCILCLAFLDITNCCFGLIIEILDIRFLYDWMAITVCKVVRFNHTFMSTSSGLILVLIAVERYNLVCHIARKKLTVYKATACCVGMVILGLFFAWPAAILHGHKTVTVQGINVTECSIDDSYHKSIYLTIYHIMQLAVFVAAMGTVTMLYVFIALKIRDANKRRKRNTMYRYTSRNKAMCEFNMLNPIDIQVQASIDTDGFEVVRFTDKNEINGEREPSTGLRNSLEFDRVLSNGTYDSEDGLSSVIDPEMKPSRQSHVVKRRYGRNQQTRRVTIMMFVISLVFLLSFLPHLSLMIMKALNDGFVSNFSRTESVIYNIFLRSYFINNVTNPIIYGIYDHRLRQECKKFVKSILTCSKKH